MSPERTGRGLPEGGLRRVWSSLARALQPGLTRLALGYALLAAVLVAVVRFG